MKEIIKEQELNRVVVAACSPKTHEAIFMDTLQATGLNKYLFEMANIRNQGSWVHANEKDEATDKAKDLVRMAVARSATLEPLSEKTISVIQKALVIGGGVSGMHAALGMAEQGYEVFLVEKEERLGGMANQLKAVIEGDPIRPFLDDLIERVNNHDKIQVLTQSLIVGFEGFKGNFTTEVLVGPGMYERKIDHGVVILATGAKEYAPTEYSYAEDDRVMTQIELSNYLEDLPQGAPDSVVMIQCVGSRNEENPNCSRICCQNAVKNALHIKKEHPDTDVFILYRDIRTYGLMEEYYTEARRLGVIFVRFKEDEPPQVEPSADGVAVTFRDHVLGKRLMVTADVVALSAGLVAEDTAELASIVKLARTPEGFFMEAHVKLRPVDMGTEGIFVCGTAHSPKLITESIAQANAAASRAVTFLSQTELTLSAVTATVQGELCAACLVGAKPGPMGYPKTNMCQILPLGRTQNQCRRG